MKIIVAYVSSHGFGHWAQMSPVLETLHRIDPDVRIMLRTNLSKTILGTPGFPFDLLPGQVDIGVIQRDAISEDIPATIEAVEQFHSTWEERISQELDLLRESGADMVISDISPLAFAAASQSAIPSIGIASIDWYAIYSSLFPSEHAILDQIAAAHQRCDLLLKLPLGMPLPSFPRQREIGLIARNSDVPRQMLRQGLGYSGDERLALVMFGGSGVPAFRIESLAGIEGWCFMMPSPPSIQLPANVREAPKVFSMPDLIAAADVIVCKPGYGIISEAWLAETPLIYVPRLNFPEYPYLRDWLEANAPAYELDRQSFEYGDWADALEAAAKASERTYPPCPVGGEIEAASIIQDMLIGGALGMAKD